jgi:hypothetical protein
MVKSGRMRWEGHVSRRGERRGVYRFLVVEPEEKRPLGTSKHRWRDNIKTDLQEVGWKPWKGLIWLKVGIGGVLL